VLCLPLVKTDLIMETMVMIATVTRDVQLGTEIEEMIHIAARLKEQRKVIIDNLMSDIAAYLNYRFAVTATRTQLEKIKDAITTLNEAVIGTDVCKAAIAEGRRGIAKPSRSGLFYAEIDKIIGTILYPSQLELGIAGGALKDGIDTTELLVREK
jgi:hypothetical protein